MNHNRSWPFFFFLFSAWLHALLDPEQISSMVIKSDNPDLVTDHITQAKSLSTQSLYPELALAQRLPFDNHLNSRLTLCGSEIIPDLASSLFTSEGLSDLSIPDPAS